MEDFKQACALLRAVLCDSAMENDFDRDIYEFLEEHNELPDDYEPYW